MKRSILDRLLEEVDLDTTFFVAAIVAVMVIWFYALGVLK